MAHTGTGGPENFGRIVGQLDTETVIEMFREGARDGWVFTENMEAIVRESAKKGSRTLILE